MGLRLLSSEEWARVRNEASHLKDSFLWEILTTERWQPRLAAAQGTLKNKSASLDDIRFAQGETNGLTYAIMSVDALILSATRALRSDSTEDEQESKDA